MTGVRESLSEIDPLEFEKFVAEIWEEQGWETKVTPPSGDRGVDVEATREFPYQEECVIQAKRYDPTKTLGSNEVRKYATLYQQEDADSVVIVSTGRFSTEAEALASDLNVKLVGGDKLEKIIDELQADDILSRYIDESGVGDLDSGTLQSSSSRISRTDNDIDALVTEKVEKEIEAESNILTALRLHLRLIKREEVTHEQVRFQFYRPGQYVSDYIFQHGQHLVECRSKPEKERLAKLIGREDLKTIDTPRGSSDTGLFVLEPPNIEEHQNDPKKAAALAKQILDSVFKIDPLQVEKIILKKDKQDVVNWRSVEKEAGSSSKQKPSVEKECPECSGSVQVLQGGTVAQCSDCETKLKYRNGEWSQPSLQRNESTDEDNHLTKEPSIMDKIYNLLS